MWNLRPREHQFPQAKRTEVLREDQTTPMILRPASLQASFLSSAGSSPPARRQRRADVASNREWSGQGRRVTAPTTVPRPASEAVCVQRHVQTLPARVATIAGSTRKSPNPPTQRRSSNCRMRVLRMRQRISKQFQESLKLVVSVSTSEAYPNGFRGVPVSAEGGTCNSPQTSHAQV